MKLPIPYEKAILIFEAFGQIKQKEPIPELILEFLTMEIEIFSKEEIQSNQPQMPHKWKILKVLYEILAMFSKGNRVSKSFSFSRNSKTVAQSVGLILTGGSDCSYF